MKGSNNGTAGESNGRTDGGETRLDGGNLSLSDAAAAKRNGERVRIPRDAVSGANATASGRRVSDIDGVGAVLYANDFNDHLENAVLYDADSGLFAVVSGNKRSESMNYAEHDWKVLSVGEDLIADAVAGEFDNNEDKDEWILWVLDEVIQYGEDGGIYGVKPDSGRFEIVLNDRDMMGMKGDRFTLAIEAVTPNDD